MQPLEYINNEGIRLDYEEFIFIACDKWVYHNSL